MVTGEVTAALEKFMRLISCYDFRVDEIIIDGKPLPKTTRYWFLEKLKEMASNGVVYLRHLSYLKPLGIRVVFGVKSDPVLARTILSVKELSNELAEQIGFPYPYLLNSVSVLGGGRVFASWIIPPGIDPDPIMDWGEVVVGDKVPIMTCLPEPRLEDINRLGSPLRELLEVEPIKPRTPVLPYVLLAVLDKYKLITFKEMAKLTNILKARDILLSEDVSDELKWKYLRKYYLLLSSRKVLGRVRVTPKVHLNYPRVTLISEPECAREIYGLMALKGYTGHIYYSDELIVANTFIDGDIQEILKSIIGKCLHDTLIRYRTTVFPFPYELYDPLENRWHTRPVEGFVKLLRKIRLLSKHEAQGA